MVLTGAIVGGAITPFSLLWVALGVALALALVLSIPWQPRREEYWTWGNERDAWAGQAQCTPSRAGMLTGRR